MYLFFRKKIHGHPPGSAVRAIPIASPLAIACCLLFSACNVTKHLDKAQIGPLLVKNSLEIKTEKPLPLDQRTPLQYELSSLYRQKPNERSILALGTRARLWYYFKFKDGKKKLSRWVMSKIAEEPAVYDEELSLRTANNIQNYMRQRGYFDAKAAYTVRYSDKRPNKQAADTPPDSTIRYAKAAVTYTLELGSQYHIGKVVYTSRDSNVLDILQKTSGSAQIKTGGPLDARSFEAEKLRITAELKNRGYAFFIPNFVEFTGDSTNTVTDVTVEVLPQSDSALHRTYILGNIAVFSDLVPDLSSIRRDTTIDSIYFATSALKFEVKPSRLKNAITLRPGMLYRQEEFDKTVHNLNALGIFRFVTIRPLQDSIQPEKINVTISFSLTKQFPIDGDVDLNSSTSSVSGRLLGVSGSLSAVNRNLLHGAENIRSNIAYSLEFDLSPRRKSLIFSQEFKFQNELRFPRYFDYFGVWRGLRGIRAISTSFYDRLRKDGQARVSLNYNFLDLRGFYVYNLFNAAFGYDLRSGVEHQYAFDNFGIDILRPKLSPLFDSLFGQNEFLNRSFGNQLFSGFLMRSFTYTYSSRTNAFGERWFFRLNTELSGLEELALNRLWALPFGKQTWTIADLEFAKFARINLDGSYTRVFSKNLTAAVRVGVGAAAAFGDTEGVPYVKQFFVGGPSSIRAWRIRELGPGANPVNSDIQPYYQAGDFRFEFNGELRFPLFWWIKGAVFVDGGNIWNFKPDDPNLPGARPDTELRWDSYKNIALGTGFGLRFDFDYFVFRFDWGLKLRRPYKTETENYWVDWSGAAWRDISNFNLAVGYPF